MSEPQPRDIRPEDPKWAAYTPTEHATILFIRKADSILLIHKKRGLGHGKVNGPGGRLEPGETPAQAAVRETTEEVGLTPADPRHVAEHHFIFTNGYKLKVSVFTAATYAGTLTETEEAAPFWCPVSQIPYDRMWADDRLWLPRVLAGETVFGQFLFDEDVMVEARVSEGLPS